MRERGLSLVELLVAMTILAIAMTIALVFYDHARRSFKTGENVTEEQQGVRIAYDVLVRDIGMAGFNTHPDGNLDRPDEQIEAAAATAIVVRADFDSEDVVERETPELALAGAGSAFSSVSTGNDEIVAYVLAKPDGSSNGTLTFHADVGQSVRDGNVEQVDIDGIALIPFDPPYTLYRVTPDNDPSGCCTGAFLNRTPVMENVRSMRFRYFDRTGNELTPVGGAEDAASVEARASIRRIAVEIEGLTRDPDLVWIDPDDPNPKTRDRRKFALATGLTPPNLGTLAIQDFLDGDSLPPGPPAGLQLYPGHCGGILMGWTPNPPEDDVAYYRVRYGLDPLALTQERTTSTPFLYVGNLEDGSEYHVVVQAVDYAANASADSAIRSVTTNNNNVPEQPLSFTASDGLLNSIDLGWQEVVDNTGSTAGDPSSPMLRDLDGYYIYRRSHSFTPDSSDIIAGPNQVLATSNPSFADYEFVNCKNYYYYVTAVDQCGTVGPYSAEVLGKSWSDIPPKQPAAVEAFFRGTDQVQLHWASVLEDVDENLLYIGRYNIYRSEFVDDDGSEPTTFTLLTQVEDTTKYLDSVVIPSGKTVFYRVTATDVCLPPNESAPSGHVKPQCDYVGRPNFDAPKDMESVWGPTSVEIFVSNALLSGAYEALHLTFESLDTGATTTYDITSPGPTWTWSWDAEPSTNPPDFFTEGVWRVTATVDHNSGTSVCSASVSRPVRVEDGN